MCESRYQRVVAPPIAARVRVQDADGVERDVSLLAYDGAEPKVDDWLVVHSGYALGKVDDDEAASAIEQIRSAHAQITAESAGEPEERR